MRFIKNTLLILLVLEGCSAPPPKEGFSKIKRDVWYRLYRIGESERKVKPGDYITAQITCRTINDSIFYSGIKKFRIADNSSSGVLNECFSLLSEGDSAAFILPASSLFTQTLGVGLPAFLDSFSLVTMGISLVNLQTSQEYEQEKEAFTKWIQDFNEYEKELLTRFIKGEHLALNPTPSGLYYLRLRPGNGRKIVRGDTLTIHYEGRFLDGKFFDSTIQRNEPFQFVIGQEWQVIKGLEEGLLMMEEGEKALLILPSPLAFGKEGSSTGIVPSYTSLVYEVEVLKVKPGDNGIQNSAESTQPKPEKKHLSL